MPKPENCILIIDDDQDQIDLLKEVFTNSNLGIKLVTAVDQTSAMAYLADAEAYRVRKPSLILLDLGLPNREIGLQLLVKIKLFYKELSQLAIPIVMLTHSNDRRDVVRCYELGANAYMLKPLDYQGWVALSQALYTYWFETVTLPKSGW